MLLMSLEVWSDHGDKEPDLLMSGGSRLISTASFHLSPEVYFVIFINLANLLNVLVQ